MILFDTNYACLAKHNAAVSEVVALSVMMSFPWLIELHGHLCKTAPEITCEIFLQALPLLPLLTTECYAASYDVVSEELQAANKLAIILFAEQNIRMTLMVPWILKRNMRK